MSRRLSVVLGALLLTCCSTSNSAPVDDLNAAELAFLIPLGTSSDDYFERANVIYHAEVQRRVTECMNAAGFEYDPPQLELKTSGSVDWTSASLEYASEMGFGQTERLIHALEAEPANPNQAYIDALTPSGRDAYWDVFDGRGVGGCQRAAYDEVESEFGTGEALQTANRLIEGAESSEHVMQRQRNWSHCMAQRGFDFDSHSSMAQGLAQALDAASLSLDAASLGEARRFEIGLAVANHHCGTEYRRERREALRDGLSSVDTAYQNAADVWIEQTVSD